MTSSDTDSTAELDLRPLPLETLDAAPFWQGCRDGKLLIQLCGECGTHQFYPRLVCTSCGGTDLQSVEVSGHATVYALTVCHKPLARRFASMTPYVVALVDLDEGPRMMTNIVGCAHSDVHIGMQVEVAFHDLGGAVSLPVFQPRASA